jgi:hypothetical protein
MPVECIVDHPGFMVLPAAGRGILITLILYYWQTGFRNLPVVEYDLFSVARANPKTWAHHREEIMKVLNDIKGEMMTTWQHDMGVYTSRRAHALSIQSISAERRSRKNRVSHGSREDARAVRGTEEREPAPRAPADGGERTKFKPRLRG